MAIPVLFKETMYHCTSNNWKQNKQAFIGMNTLYGVQEAMYPIGNRFLASPLIIATI